MGVRYGRSTTPPNSRIASSSSASRTSPRRPGGRASQGENDPNRLRISAGVCRPVQATTSWRTSPKQPVASISATRLIRTIRVTEVGPPQRQPTAGPQGLGATPQTHVGRDPVKRRRSDNQIERIGGQLDILERANHHHEVTTDMPCLQPAGQTSTQLNRRVRGTVVEQAAGRLARTRTDLKRSRRRPEPTPSGAGQTPPRDNRDAPSRTPQRPTRTELVVDAAPRTSSPQPTVSQLTGQRSVATGSSTTGTPATGRLAHRCPRPPAQLARRRATRPASPHRTLRRCAKQLHPAHRLSVIRRQESGSVRLQHASEGHNNILGPMTLGMPRTH
jgi:hypothetical protein